MKTLILMRHAKSDWSQDELSDFGRPLNKRGRRAASVMAAYLSRQGLVPDYALVSSSVRTRETWERMSGDFSAAPPPHDLRRDLYLARPRTILEAINSLSEMYKRVLVLAHNPGIEQCAGLLAAPEQNSAGEAALASLRAKFPTAGAAIFRLPDTPWAEIRFGTGELLEFAAPSRLVS
jgi:phosphohistidine phosphatase